MRRVTSTRDTTLLPYASTTPAARGRSLDGGDPQIARTADSIDLARLRPGGALAERAPDRSPSKSSARAIRSTRKPSPGALGPASDSGRESLEGARAPSTSSDFVDFAKLDPTVSDSSGPPPSHRTASKRPALPTIVSAGAVPQDGGPDSVVVMPKLETATTLPGRRERSRRRAAVNITAMEQLQPRKLDPAELQKHVDELRQTCNELAILKSKPREMRDPLWSDMVKNALVQLAGNLTKFTLPTYLYALANSSGSLNSLASSGLYASSIAIANVLAQELEPMLLDTLGGSVTNPRFNFGDHSNHGPYLLVAAKLAQIASNVLYHGAVHATMTWQDPEFFSKQALGSLARGAAAGLGMASVGQLVNTVGAKLTLRRNGVEHVAELEVPEGSRNLKNGLYQNSVGRWQDTMSSHFKSIQVAGSTLQSLAGAVALFGVSYAGLGTHLDKAGVKMPDLSAVDQSLKAVYGGYSGYFTMAAIVEAAYTRLVTDPRLHVHRNGLSAQAAAGALIKQCGMNRMEDILNKAGVEFENHPDVRVRGHYLDMVEVLSGKALRGEAVSPTPPNSVRPDDASGSLGAAMTGSGELPGPSRGRGASADRASISSNAAFVEGSLQALRQSASERAINVTSVGADSGTDRESLRRGPWSVSGQRVDHKPVIVLKPAAGSVSGLETTRERPDLYKARRLQDSFEALAAGIRARSEAPDDRAPDPRYDQTLEELAERLDHAALSLEIARHNAEGTGVLQPELRDIRYQLRSMQGLLAKCMFRIDGSDNADNDAYLRNVAAQLFPVFVAMRRAERLDAMTSFFSGLKEVVQKRKPLSSALAALTAPPHGRLLVSDLASHVQRMGQDRDLVLDLVQSRMKPALSGQPLSALEGKLLILKHALEAQDRADLPEHQGRANLERRLDAFEALPAKATRAERQRIGADFVQAFVRGDFTLKQLADRLAQLHEASEGARGAPLDAERAGPSVRALRAFTRVLGRPFVEAVAEEAHPLHQQDGAAFEAQLFKAMEQDIRSWPRNRQELTIAGLKMESLPKVRDVPMTPAFDAHKHHNTYSGSKNSVERQALFDEKNKIMGSLYSPIPSQVYCVEWNAKYYTSTKHLMSYYANDAGLATQERQRRDPDRAVIDLHKHLLEEHLRNGGTPEHAPQIKHWPTPKIFNATTNVNPTDKGDAKRAIRDTLRYYPDVVFVGVGETTFQKEGVQEVNPHEFRVASEASRNTVLEAARAGMFLLAHCDGGDSANKTRHFDDWVGVIKSVARELRDWKATDDLRARPGNETIPSPKLNLLWAHWGGGARFTNFAMDHWNRVHEFLNDPELKPTTEAAAGIVDASSLSSSSDVTRPELSKREPSFTHVRVFIDMSWDYCMHQAWQNIATHLDRADVKGDVAKANLWNIQGALDMLLKSYQVFSEEGSRADHADDAGMPNTMGISVVASEDMAKTHLKVLAEAYTQQMEHAMEDDETRAFFVGMARRTDNPIGLIAQNPYNCIYGTDTLAPGSKAHGDALYAINARNLEPINVIFQQLAAHGESVNHRDPELSGDRIVELINRENMRSVLEDKHALQRMAANRQDVATEQPYDWSNGVRPNPPGNVERAAVMPVPNSRAKLARPPALGDVGEEPEVPLASGALPPPESPSRPSEVDMEPASNYWDHIRGLATRRPASPASTASTEDLYAASVEAGPRASPDAATEEAVRLPPDPSAGTSESELSGGDLDEAARSRFAHAGVGRWLDSESAAGASLVGSPMSSPNGSPTGPRLPSPSTGRVTELEDDGGSDEFFEAQERQRPSRSPSTPRDAGLPQATVARGPDGERQRPI